MPTTKLRIKLTCVGCGRSFEPKESANRYCSRTCQRRDIGRLSAAARGDAMRGVPRSPDGVTRARYVKRGGQHEHRTVAEAILGRKLLPGEQVHHLDEDKRNNAPWNLAVLKSNSEHLKEHAQRNAYIRWGRLDRLALLPPHSHDGLAPLAPLPAPVAPIEDGHAD